MKATGVVRRIDDLGRIVIPKEIRKNYKINEGDSLEIFVDNNGVILKKYSLTDDILEISKHIVDSFSQIYQKNLIITNKDQVIYASHDFHFYIEKDLNSNIKDRIEDRLEFITSNNLSIILNDENSNFFFLVPILVNSETVGSVILVDNDISENDKNLIRFITSILVKNLE